MDYLDESPERVTWSDEGHAYTPRNEPGPYGTRCTLRPGHQWSHYDGSDDSSWQDRWTEDVPDPDD